MDAFASQLVSLVRSMPDEAILALVRSQLDEVAPAVLGAAPARAARTAPPGRARAPGRPKGRRGGRARTGRVRAPSPKREALLGTVEKVVTGAKGLSASDVAKAARVPQSRAASALRELKGAKRIFQGGDRRFARYAGDAKTALAASEAARSTASGPVARGKGGAKRGGKRKRA